MLRWISDGTLKGQIKNDNIQGKFEISSIEVKTKEDRVRWFGLCWKTEKTILWKNNSY